VAVRSNARFCSRSLAGIAGSNSAGWDGDCLLWILVVVQVEASATGWSLIQGSPMYVDCVSLNVIRHHNNPLHLKLLGSKTSDSKDWSDNKLFSWVLARHTSFTKAESNKQHYSAVCSENKQSSTHSPSRESSFPNLHTTFQAEDSFAHKNCLLLKL